MIRHGLSRLLVRIVAHKYCFALVLLLFLFFALRNNNFEGGNVKFFCRRGVAIVKSSRQFDFLGSFVELGFDFIFLFNLSRSRLAELEPWRKIMGHVESN